jgi:general stress protein 26
MDGTIDFRFSDPDAGATPWDDPAAALARAERYWITTVRADGRPHVTPLIGVWHDGAMHFGTGMREQKAHDLVHNDSVALTTGINTWAEGLVVVVERTAVRVADRSGQGGASD